MLTWKTHYQGRQKFLVGYKNDTLYFTVTEDSGGYFRLQGFDKFKNHSTRYLDEETAKNKAEERMTWGKL